MNEANAVNVRPAGPPDRDAIVGFNVAMALETEGRRLDPDRMAAGASAVFDDPEKGRYLVAERDGEVIGCLLVTHEWSDWRNGTFWWIQSVYVPAPYRRTGVFRALYDHVDRSARATPGVCGIRLYVERENEAAQRVYDAVGMHRTSYRFYEVDYVR